MLKNIKELTIIKINGSTSKNFISKFGQIIKDIYKIRLVFNLNFLNNKWWKWFLSPLKGFLLFNILNMNNRNMSKPGIIKIKKIFSQEKLVVVKLYL